MNKEKHLLIHSENDANIGVLTSIEGCASDNIEQLKPRLKQALMEHFDADVEIIKHMVTNEAHPIEMTVKVKIDSSDDSFEENIFLTETWFY
jgi:hypothetical protein